MFILFGNVVDGYPEYIMDIISVLLRNIGEGRYIETRISKGISVFIPEATYNLLSRYPELIYRVLKPLMSCRNTAPDVLYTLAKIFSIKPSKETFLLLIDAYKSYPYLQKDILGIISVIYKGKGPNVGSLEDIEVILSGDPKNRVQQIVAIGYLYRSTQDVQVLDKLVRYVDNPDSSIRNAVARAIGLIFRGKPLGLEYAIKKITRIGTNLSHEVALKAISVAIRGMPDEFFAHKSIHQYIELLLECSNPTLKSMAIETLGSIFIRTNDVRLLRILEKVLEPSTLIGLAMLKALSMVYYKSGNRSALNLLLKLLEINGDCVRRMAIEAMGLIFKNTQDVHVGHIITQMYDGRDHEVFRRTIERIYGEFNSLRIKVIVLGHKIKSKIFDKMPDYVKKHEDLITSGAKFYTFYDVFELHPLGVVFVEYVVWSLDMSPSYKKIRQLYYSGSKLAVIVIIFLLLTH